MHTYYTKTDDRWYTSFYGQRLRLGSTRLILCLLPGHVLCIVLYFKVDYEEIISQIVEIFEQGT
jgi:hypothetical protein